MRSSRPHTHLGNCTLQCTFLEVIAQAHGRAPALQRRSQQPVDMSHHRWLRPAYMSCFNCLTNSRCPAECKLDPMTLMKTQMLKNVHFAELHRAEPYSSSGGISSSMYRTSDIRISVVSLPRRTSLMKCTSTCICTCSGISNAAPINLSLAYRPRCYPTISNAPRSTPTSMFENHSSSCARPSSGSSTKSARGFSSKIRENCLLSLVQFVMVGVMLRNILKPT